MKSSTWIKVVLILTVLGLGVCAAATAYIDPFLHYHGPLSSFQYPLNENDERYLNYGIVKNFTYDALITGSSMCENFKTTEFDSLWGTNSVKAAFAGGSYKEIDELIRRALEVNPEIKYVIRSLDYSSLLNDKDEMMTFNFVHPTYLYDDNLFNDVYYLLNKDVLFNKTYEVIRYTHVGGVTTTFDAYANWCWEEEYGDETVLEAYDWSVGVASECAFTEEQRNTVVASIHQNVIETAQNNPDVIFYVFFPPYSICYWDMMHINGQINMRIDAEKCAIEELLQCPNIKLYSFCTNYELVCNLDNYMDQAHFGEWVNSRILNWMYADEYLLTTENYEEYINSIREFYNSYDYASLH